MIEELRQKKLDEILSQLTEIKKVVNEEEKKEKERQDRLEYLMGNRNHKSSGW